MSPSSIDTHHCNQPLPLQAFCVHSSLALSRGPFAHHPAFRPPVLHSSLLAVATRKRLMLFHFQGNEFVELKDIGLSDIHCMQWLGDSICVGVKRECAAFEHPARPNQPVVLLRVLACPCARSTACIWPTTVRALT